MRKLIFAFIFSFPVLLQAQMEIGIIAGVSNYSGELAPESFKAGLSQTHAAAGLFFRYNIFNHLTAKLHANYAGISGDDAKADQQQRLERNLSFRSNIWEFGLTAEINILGYNAYNYESPVSPYLFVGFSGFMHNPQAYYDNKWVDLQALGTEGQGIAQFPERKPYKLFDFAIPFGVGVKYAINDKWNVGLEVGFRTTFTDYLDDISTTYVEYSELEAGNGELAAALANRTGEYLDTEPVSLPTGTARGDATKKDWFVISGITVSYNFTDNGLVGSRGRNRRKSGCQTF